MRAPRPATRLRPSLTAVVLVAALLTGSASPAWSQAAHPGQATRVAPAAGQATTRARQAGSAGADLYVNAESGFACSDSGPGTQTEPFCTIAAAAAVVQPGQTVIVEPGSYAGITISVSGTASAPITFMAENGPRAVVTIESNGFVVSGAHNVVISGFINVTEQPYLIENSSDITINGGSAESGSHSSPSIQVTGTSSNITISRLTITGGSSAVEIDQGATGVVVTTNTVITADTSDTPSVPDVLVTDAPGADIVSNTLFAGCSAAVVIAGASPGTALENNIVETGRVIATGPKACAEPENAIAFSVSAGSTPQTVADYNLIDPTSGGPLYNWGGTDFSSLASFTAATGEGMHDIAASAGLSPDECGTIICYPPSATSPAIDSADANAPGELATDQLGNPRADDPSVPNTGTGSGFYDRGAVELEGPLSFGALSVQPDPAGGPLSVTATAPMTTSWITNGPIGSDTFYFSDTGLVPITAIGSPPGTERTFTTAGTYEVEVWQAESIFLMLSTVYYNVQDGYTTVGADYTPVTPTRILDTRSGIGVTRGAISPGGDLTLPVGSIGQVSAADISAVAVNVTVTAATAAGALTVFAQPGYGAATSDIDFSAGQTLANLVTIQPVGGVVRFQNNSKGTVQVVADLDGYYSGAGSGFDPVTPLRVLDTRSKLGVSSGPVPARGTVKLNLSGHVPPGATAAVLNLTATQPTAAGFITAYSDGQARPGTSNLDFVAGQTVPNQVIVPLSNDVADFYNGSTGTVQLVADLDGYYVSGAPGALVPVGPTRIVDTRVGIGAPTGAIPAHGTLVITPVNYSAAGCSNPEISCSVGYVLNITVTQPKAAGLLTVYPDSGPPPNSSSVNFSAGQTIANLVTVPEFNGNIVIYNDSSGSVQVVVDEEGDFLDQP
jgi:hypothetical protein